MSYVGLCVAGTIAGTRFFFPLFFFLLGSSSWGNGGGGRDEAPSMPAITETTTATKPMTAIPGDDDSDHDEGA